MKKKLMHLLAILMTLVMLLGNVPSFAEFDVEPTTDEPVTTSAPEETQKPEETEKPVET